MTFNPLIPDQQLDFPNPFYMHDGLNLLQKVTRSYKLVTSVSLGQKAY